MCLNYKWEKTSDTEESQKGKSAVRKTKKDSGPLGATVLESVKLYLQKYPVEKIAKIRSLGVSTVFGHLSQWYVAGGALRVEDFVSPEQEKKILAELNSTKEFQRLSQIKEKLGDDISYEQIRLVLAKKQRDIKK